MLKPIARLGRRNRQNDNAHLAVNFSYVLHERSDSQAVTQAVRASIRHRARMNDRRFSPRIESRSHEWSNDADLWLSATIGVPDQLAAVLAVPRDRIVAVDQQSQNLEPRSLFRNDAALVLPPSARRVGVAGVILRPNHATAMLVLGGVFDWATQEPEALRAIERLIQAHVGQWMPPRALWSEPAEQRFPDEVY